MEKTDHKIGKLAMEFHTSKYMDCQKEVSSCCLHPTLYRPSRILFLKILLFDLAAINFLYFQGFNDTTDVRKKTSMTTVKTHEFSVHLLKKKIASIVANRHKGNRTILQEKINDLTCQCIFAFSCWTMESNTRTEKKVLVEDQVSNVCLRMLNFLILDGEDRIDNNLKTLYEQSMNYIEKRRSSTDEVMLDVISPVYVKFFANRYQKLKNESNYTDPFIYNQRFNAWALGGMFFDDNEIVCGEDTFCYETLLKLASTWNNISGVMEFPWEMGMGSLIANFNYLLDICVNTKNGPSALLQEDEHQWSGFKNNTGGQCQFDNNLEVFYDDMATLSAIISNTIFQGMYLNDLFGFLGYSPTFDISSLTEDGYVSAGQNLHPIYGMDRWLGNSKYNWEPCVYRSTYQRWTKNIKASMQNDHLGIIRI